MQKIYFPDNAVILDPCRDAVFKLIFTRATPESRIALDSLVSAFLGRNTHVIAVTPNEPPVNSPGDRQIRFDIACKFDGDERANLEMTLFPRRHEPTRLEYHLARLFVNQDIKGQTYDNLKQAYQISFFARESLYADTALVHHFRYYDTTQELSLGGRTEIITVELRKAVKLLGREPREMSLGELWAFFFRYGPDPERREQINKILAAEEGIAMAGAELLTVSEDERLQAWLMSAEKYELDRTSDLYDARRDGYEEAKAEYQEQLSSKDEQLSSKDEQLSAKDEQIRQDNERIGHDQERIRWLEEEIRRLRGE
jgi:hypothetical protein